MKQSNTKARRGWRVARAVWRETLAAAVIPILAPTVGDVAPWLKVGWVAAIAALHPELRARLHAPTLVAGLIERF